MLQKMLSQLSFNKEMFKLRSRFPKKELNWKKENNTTFKNVSNRKMDGCMLKTQQKLLLKKTKADFIKTVIH